MNSLTTKTKVLNLFRSIFMLRPNEVALATLTRGKTFGSMITRLVPNHYQYPKGSKRRVVRNGISYLFDLSDMVDWFNYFGFREIERDNYYKLLDNNNVVIDVGANIGEFSLKTAKLIGRLGRVYAFEPDPENFERMKSNVSLNPELSLRISVQKLGLGETPGQVKLAVVNSTNRGMNRVVNDADQFTNVPLTTLDMFAKSEHIHQINWIKIDVEGYELKVLKGAEETIKQLRPSLFIELDDNNLRQQMSSASALITWLQKHNYKITNAASGKEVSSAGNFEHCHLDVIAIPF